VPDLHPPPYPTASDWPPGDPPGTTLGELPDATIIERSLRDPECFAVLYTRHGADIKRYVVRRLGSDAAEDVVADTYLSAFQRRGAYDTARESARPWLYGIATNLIRRHRRAELGFYRALARTGVDPVAESFTERADARIGAQTVRRELGALLAGLPAGQRDVLLLMAWADLSYEETAAALDVPIGTVRYRWNRARAKLRKALGEVDPTALTKEDEHG
jgi:RNA polymerase sigma factor (sigma-70 family)